MQKAIDPKKDGRVFLYHPQDEKPPIEIVVLMDGGPLCVGRAYDYSKGDIRNDLYWLYVKKCGAHIGPYFADIHLAFKAMRKIVKHFGVPFFEQPLEWLRRQDTAKVWIDRNIGKLTDLIGGEWAKEEE